jgi:hypothetical protein
VLQYLGRYTHRVAISNHRLVSFAGGKVTFRWRDSAHNNEQKLRTLSLDEFLRHFLLHVLPKGFVRIRNFGFLANRRRATLLALCFQLLGSAPQTEQGHSEIRNAPSRTLPTRPWSKAKMSVVKSCFYLTKIHCGAVPASLSQGLGFAETPDLSSCAVLLHLLVPAYH